MAIILFTITSCQKDDVPQETIQEGPQFEVEKLTGSQLTSNRSLNKALLEAKANLSITSAQKYFYDSINGFWIDDSQVNHVSSGDYESYTFGIYYSLDTLGIQNLVFHRQKDSTYLPIVLSYEFNQIDSTQITIKYRILDSSFILDNIAKNDAGGLLDINPCGWDTSDCLCWRIVGYEGGNPITQLEVQNNCSWEADSNSQHDAVIPNKPRGSGINMGGNIKQNFKWTETYP